MRIIIIIMGVLEGFPKGKFFFIKIIFLFLMIIESSKLCKNFHKNTLKNYN